MEQTEKNLASLRNEYHGLIESSEINGQGALALASRCRELIFHIHQRIEYCEHRRGQMVIIALSLLAASVALFAATFLGSLQVNPVVVLVRLSALFLFLTSLVTLLLYSFQTNYRYPFISVTQTWRWFYHYAVSKEYKPPFIPFERTKTRERMQKLHLQDMREYAAKVLLSTPKEELEQDLEQLFLAIVNEKYKNAQLTHLRWVIFLGLGLTVLIVVVAAILSL